MANANEPIVWENGVKPLKELLPAAYNPRRMPENEARELRKSLERFGLVDPLILNKDGMVIGGHQRLKIMLDLGILEADVRIPSRKLTPREERELNLRLNKNAGVWDWDKIKNNFERDILDDVGFEDSELDQLFNEPVEGLDDMEEPEAKKDGKNAKQTAGSATQKQVECPSCGNCFTPVDQS